jgi:hypothetical protein
MHAFKYGLIGCGAMFLSMCAPALAVVVSLRTTTANQPDVIWSKIKGFCDITNALPTLKCALSADGQTRTLTTPDGKNVVEKLEAHDDAGRTYSYTILEPGPLPVANYHSKIAIVPEGAGSAIVWTGKFDAKGASDEEAKKVIEGIYKTGSDTLAK